MNMNAIVMKMGMNATATIKFDQEVNYATLYFT